MNLFSKPTVLVSRPILLIVLFFVCAILAAINLYVQGAPIFPFDDAYITLHNARVLLTGIEPNYEGVSPLTGSTSPLHLVLLAVFGLLIPLEWADYVLCSVAFFLYLSFIGLLAQKKAYRYR